MGLSVIIRAKKQVGYYNCQNEEDYNYLKNIKDAIKKDLPNVDTNEGINLSVDVISMQKLGYVHNWCKVNVQNRGDDYREYTLSRTKIRELIELLLKFLDEESNEFQELKKEALTPGYINYVLNIYSGLIEELKDLLTDKWKEWEFTYEAFW